jgi:prepilin-type N-terminal cleavage/methylation domain-containing protein
MAHAILKGVTKGFVIIDYLLTYKLIPQSFMKKNFKSGFTLIELLVVIAIIGILASVVLASLNTARAKGADAKVKSQLANARAQAEIYFDDPATGNQSYRGVCDSGNTGNISALVYDTSFMDPGCGDDATAWAAWAQLKSTTGYWCVDSTGFSNKVSSGGSAGSDDSSATRACADIL